jgi:hypothetical protein
VRLRGYASILAFFGLALLVCAKSTPWYVTPLISMLTTNELSPWRASPKTIATR